MCNKVNLLHMVDYLPACLCYFLIGICLSAKWQCASLNGLWAVHMPPNSFVFVYLNMQGGVAFGMRVGVLQYLIFFLVSSGGEVCLACLMSSSNISSNILLPERQQLGVCACMCVAHACVVWGVAPSANHSPWTDTDGSSLFIFWLTNAILLTKCYCKRKGYSWKETTHH